MSEKPLILDPVEFETPPYGGRYIFLIVLWAFVSLGLHVGLYWLMPSSNWFNIPNFGLRNGGLLGGPVATVMPGCTVIWKGQLWTSVISGGLPTPGVMAVRPVSSRLVAIDLTTGVARETNITLSPTPFGLIVIDDQLWAVAENAVTRIQNEGVIERHPRRSLIHPSKPFAYAGRLAVIDKDRNEVLSMLTWSNGEWIEEGRVDLPIAPTASPWFIPELRVLTNDHLKMLFYSNGQIVSYREGFDLQVSEIPVSAEKPENKVDPLAALGPNVAYGPNLLPGFTQTPFPNTWGALWDVVAINDEVWAFVLSSPYSQGPLQQFHYRKGKWVSTTPKFPPRMQSFGTAADSSVFLVSDDLRLFSLKGSTLEQVTTGTPMSERIRSVLNRFGLIAAYLLSTSVLVLGTAQLMRVYRNPQYLYGKRTVIQASILRRAMARGMDLVLTLFPAFFWFSVLIDVEVQNQLQQQANLVGIQNPLMIVLFSIFGMWLGVLLVLSFMEGQWGFTPGKWLLGIRTLRTTLRPCGMLRAFARELLVYADSLFLMIWLPGVLLIALTPNWQRLGDLTADTVVVLDPKR